MSATEETQTSLPHARPYAFRFPPSRTALLIIDMQRDFLDPNGFGSIQCGNDEIFGAVRRFVPTLQQVLKTCRALGMPVIHTREGHRPDLSDLPAAKRMRQISAPNGHHSLGIGDQGPMGRLLVRGERGHDIIDDLTPWPDEVIIDKPGKGSFWGTDIHRALLARGITHILFAGVTTECCVTTTLRECNDRGYECCILSDCTNGFDAQQVQTAMDTICGQDGLFGYVGHSSDFFAQVTAPSNLPLTPPPESDDAHLPSIPELLSRYRSGHESPVRIVNLVFDHIEKYQRVDPAAWISISSREVCIAAAEALATKYAGKPLPPLFGLPFAVKDNIDVAGQRTTAACEAYAYIAKEHAPVVQHLLDAGAILIGKCNMDQLATGLSGCRSPWGTPHSVHSADHISGGSSSGSGVVVAAGLVSFSLGTDTAGSGRVPAAFNGIVGLKPTKGTLSARGVVPACKSLDTVSIMAMTLADARRVWIVANQHDPLDPYAKSPASLTTWHIDFRGPKLGGFTFAIPPDEILAACSEPYRKLFTQTVIALQNGGGTIRKIDYTPFQEAVDLVYATCFVYERIASIGTEFVRNNLENLHPTTKALFSSALEKTVQPWDVFNDLNRQTILKMQAQRVFAPTGDNVDVLVVPTAPLHPTVAEMEADPLGLNYKCGYFTNPANVVDLCGVSVNAGWYEAGGKRLPFGVTFLGGMGYDAKVMDIAAVFEHAVKK